jgi:hypothetical protein
MTRRTSSINDHSLNSIAFRASIGLPKEKSTTFNAPEPGTKLPPKRVETDQFTANDAKHRHLRASSAELTSRFPHRTHPDPTASS